MDENLIPGLKLLNEGSDRMTHHWVNLETFHAEIMRHTTKQTFQKIIIFVSEDVLRELRELWVNSDPRVIYQEKFKDLPGYEYSYRLMPVLTDCQTHEEPKYITQGKYIVAYYNEMAELPTVAMGWKDPAAIEYERQLRAQKEMDFGEVELDIEGQEPEPVKQFANTADLYYNGPKPLQQQEQNAAAYYANPRKLSESDPNGGWDPSDYGGPGE